MSKTPRPGPWMRLLVSVAAGTGREAGASPHSASGRPELPASRSPSGSAMRSVASEPRIASRTSKSTRRWVGAKSYSEGRMSVRASQNARYRWRPFAPGKSGGLGPAKSPPSGLRFIAYRTIHRTRENPSRIVLGYQEGAVARNSLKWCLSPGLNRKYRSAGPRNAPSNVRRARRHVAGRSLPVRAP